MSGPLLAVRNLVVGFPGAGGVVDVVRGVDFAVHPGETLCIVGESGSGKSVTALAVAGLLPGTAKIGGAVTLDGAPVLGADAATMRRIRGTQIGFVFQDPGTTLNPVLPVGRQVTEGQVAMKRLRAADAPARAVELLREVEIADPGRRAIQYPHQFSGGMRQRAVVAMAMAGRPTLMIADEPTTALDVTVQAQVLALLRRRQAQTGAALILITHDLGVVAEMADRVAVMYAGRIVETAPAGEIFRNPRHPYTVALLQSIPRIDMTEERLEPIPGQPVTPAARPSGCAFHPRCVRTRGRERCRVEEPSAQVAGSAHLAACHFAGEPMPAPVPAVPRGDPAPEAAAGGALLEVEALRVHFAVKAGLLRRTVAHVRAVDGVSLAVHPGETVSLVGESGCGKTTTARAVMGLVRATGGTVRFEGRPILGLGRHALRGARRHMQYVFQDPFSSLNPVLPVEDLIAEPLRIHGLFEKMGGHAHVGTLMEMVGLSPTMFGRFAREFSGGQKQRIGIARALALRPRLLILDEPVAALDVSIQAQVLNLLQDLQRELGLGYLFVAHNLSVVRHISDRVAVMYGGCIVEEAPRERLYAEPVHPYTQSLLSAAPVPDPARRNEARRIVLGGEVPNPMRPPPGCAFHPRCFRASERCRTENPAFLPYRDTATRTACHHPGPFAGTEMRTPAAMEIAR